MSVFLCVFLCFCVRARLFTDNLSVLVEKELFQDNIRKTKFAFTVTKIGTVRQINFLWTLLMHTVMIFGCYMPTFGWWLSSYMDDFQTKVDEARGWEEGARNMSLGGGGYRRAKGGGKSDGGAGDAGGALKKTQDKGEAAANSTDMTPSDIYFFENVEPVVVWFSRIMSWINLITCGASIGRKERYQRG